MHTRIKLCLLALIILLPGLAFSQSDCGIFMVANVPGRWVHTSTGLVVFSWSAPTDWCGAGSAEAYTSRHYGVEFLAATNRSDVIKNPGVSFVTELNSGLHSWAVDKHPGYPLVATNSFTLTGSDLRGHFFFAMRSWSTNSNTNLFGMSASMYFENSLEFGPRPGEVLNVQLGVTPMIQDLYRGKHGK